MEQEFLVILEKGKVAALQPFLQLLTDAQKKLLAPRLVSLTKEYLEYREVTRGSTSTFEMKATGGQKQIVLTAAFFCCTRSQFEKTAFPSWILEEETLRPVISWYCPAWFSDFANRLAAQNMATHFLNYAWLMELSDRGMLAPGKELVTRVLPAYLYVAQNRQQTFDPQRALLHPLTLQEHIWYFFEVESGVNWMGKYTNLSAKEKHNQTWIVVFKQYAAEGRIDRRRVLKESLLATSKNFNKYLSGWFCELFVAMEPVVEELLELQSELLIVLNAPPGKPVNIALQYIKKIQGEKSFRYTDFLDNVPVLLAAQSKTTVLATLQVLDKLARKYPGQHAGICTAVIQVFISTDDELQERTAKLLLACNAFAEPAFKEMLEPYAATMTISARTLLEAEMNGAGAVIATDPMISPATGDDPFPIIPAIKTTDDLVFLASQAFDNNESWHIDLLPAALVNLQHSLSENSNHLEAALQRALQLVKGEYRGHQGNLDHLLAVFFIDACIVFARRNPGGSQALQQVFEKFNQQDGGSTRKWTAKWPGAYYLEDWSTHSKEVFYRPYKAILLAALVKIDKRDTLPLVSTPTHAPAWVSAAVLAQRLALYQAAGITPDSMDLQVAIARTKQCSDEPAGVTLSGEYQHLFAFLTGSDAEPQPPFINKEAWMMASLSRPEKKQYAAFDTFPWQQLPFELFTGQYQWTTEAEEQTTQRYSYEQGKYIPVKILEKIIQVQVPRAAMKEPTGVTKVFGNLLGKIRTEPRPGLLYDYMVISSNYRISEQNDARRILLLAPNNPEPLLAQVLKKCLHYSTFSTELDKRFIIACLRALSETWSNVAEMAHVFLGTCMLAGDKTLAAIAGETWLKVTTAGTINNILLGKILGIHERVEYAPLKRLTDLISQLLLNHSPYHNQQLRLVIGQLLPKLPDAPVKNLKKLLEIYAGLLTADDPSAEEVAMREKLDRWSETAALTKIISLIKRNGS